MAFLNTLTFAPPGPAPSDEAVRRGRALFKAKACGACHIPPLYTSDEIFRVGLEDYGDAYVGFNPPSLRGVGRRSPYLHDGRAVTLEQVFKYYHRPKKLNGEQHQNIPLSSRTPHSSRAASRTTLICPT